MTSSARAAIGASKAVTLSPAISSDTLDDPDEFNEDGCLSECSASLATLTNLEKFFLRSSATFSLASGNNSSEGASVKKVITSLTLLDCCLALAINSCLAAEGIFFGSTS